MRIENDFYLLEIDRERGRLVRLFDKIGELEIITESRLAENFRLLLPIPGMHANYILGSEQFLTSASIESHSAKLVWAGPLENEYGKFELAVTIWIELIDQEIQFRCEVKNGTEHKIAEIWYGMIGGMNGFGAANQTKSTKMLLPYSATQHTAEPFRDFGTGSAPNSGLGLLGPEYSWWYPGHMPMPWVSFYHDELERGIYYASHDTDVRSKVFRMAMAPGIAEKRADGDWPSAEELNGEPAGVTLNWTHFPYTKPGETFVGSTIVLRAHAGGWQESAAIYARWFEKKIGLVDSRNDWLRKETAFLDTMFLLPEDNVNLTFRDIPPWAKTAVDHGIGSVMISGWQVGGHDRGYPDYSPDPRLGTYDDLQAGIRACHEMGLRVYFFANVQTIDITTEQYKEELHQFEYKDPWGCPFHIMGWGMGTLGARKGLTKPPLYEFNPAHPEVRALLIGHFRKLAEIGADGIHLDKNFIHPLDFNPRLTVSPDRAISGGMITFYREMLDACRALRPDFCVSYENHWDRLMHFSEVEWWAMGPSPLKVTFPQWVSTAGIAQPYAFNQVNHCVLGGQNLIIGPANYQRAMDYPPMKNLCRYIGEITRIRRELHDFVSRGRWVDSHVKLFASRKPTLTMGGSFASSSDIGWTVFADTNTGKRAIVLANLGATPLEVTNLHLTENATGGCRIHQPFEPMRDMKFPATLTLPGERVAFVAEI